MPIRPLILILLPTLAATTVFGHGRIQTSISADIAKDSATVTLHAAVVDLIAVGGLELNHVARLSPEERTALLRPHLETMAERFRLIDLEGREFRPRQIQFEEPEVADRSQPPGIEQQRLTVNLNYVFATPPGGLLFWQSFGEGDAETLHPETDPHSPHERHDLRATETINIPIYSALSIRQQGEMVLLPCELGPGFPVWFPFDWDNAPVPVAHRSSLQSATCRWENRPPNTRLTVEGNHVSWRIYLTLEGLAQEFPAAFLAASTGSDWAELTDRLREHATLVIDEVAQDPDTISITVYPLSAMALLHHRRLTPGSGRPGLVLVEIARDLPAPPGAVDAVWTLFNESIPRLHAEILDSRRIPEISLLTSDSPTLQWRRSEGEERH
jgi:hypothetical protein